MSENFEVVRRIIDAYERRDFATLFASYDPEVELHIDERLRTGLGDFDPVYYGHDGIRAFWRRWLEAWETISFDYEEFIVAGDTVIMILSQRMRRRASGIEVEVESYAAAWTIQMGKLTRREFFPTRADALAAGLSE